MKVTLRKLVGLACCALLPAVASAHDTTYDYDGAHDFSRVKTYAIRGSTSTDNPFVDARIASAIASELAARGLTRDDANPDVYVTARQTFETHQEFTSYTSGYGPY